MFVFLLVSAAVLISPCMSADISSLFLPPARPQTCVLKVNIHCDGCEKKVKKILHKIDGKKESFFCKTQID
jgi:hypothetical protein